MKSKSYLSLALFFLLSVSFSVSAFAGALTLDKIGSVSTNGQKYTEWWYTGSNPLLTGKAESSAEVKVTVDGDEDLTTADVSGNWSYLLSKGPGDYKITLSTDVDTYAFTLHLGSNVPTSGTTTTTSTTGAASGTTTSAQSTTSAAVPSTGVNQTTALGLGLGISLLALYMYLNGEKNHKTAFEKSITKNK